MLLYKYIYIICPWKRNLVKLIEPALNLPRIIVALMQQYQGKFINKDIQTCKMRITYFELPLGRKQEGQEQGEDLKRANFLLKPFWKIFSYALFLTCWVYFLKGAVEKYINLKSYL